jgi:hypothetical protein
MKQNRINIGRRGFLKAGSLAVMSAAIAGSAANAAEKAAEQPAKVDEKEARRNEGGQSQVPEIRGGTELCELRVVSRQTDRRMGELSDLREQASGREGLVFLVCEEGLTVSSIRRVKSGRKRRPRPPFVFSATA